VRHRLGHRTLRTDSPHLADRPLVVLGLAALGVAAGHLVTFLVLVPDPGARAALLARTGHGYFGLFAQAALVVGAIGAASTVLGQIAPGARVGSTSFRSLARVQVVAFVWMEVIERVVSHAGFGDLFRADVAVGVVVQVAVAALLAWALSFLGRVAARVRRVADARRPRAVVRLVSTVVGAPPAAASTLLPPPRAPPLVSALAV
jgi:hypothetical protein